MRIEVSTKPWAKPDCRLGSCIRLASSTQWNNNCASKRLDQHYGSQSEHGKRNPY
jgi:hypothetical protein